MACLIPLISFVALTSAVCFQRERAKALSVATGCAVGEVVPGKFIDPGQLAAIGTRPR